MIIISSKIHLPRLVSDYKYIFLNGSVIKFGYVWTCDGMWVKDQYKHYSM